MTLWCLLTALLVLSGVGAHEEGERRRTCVHSTHVEPELERLEREASSISNEAHRFANNHFYPNQRRNQEASGKAKPIRIQTDYQLNELSPEKEDFLRYKLMPKVIATLQRFVKVKKPVEGKLFLPWTCTSTFVGFPDYCHQVSTRCGSAVHNRDFFGPGRTCAQPFPGSCTPLQAGSGLENKDLVLYVTSSATGACAHHYETVAMASSCILDKQNWYKSLNRPLAGSIHFCPDQIETTEKYFGYMLDIALHEIFHVLAMSSSLFNYFVVDNNRTLEQTIEKAEYHSTVTTPSVQQAAKEILNCSTATARLENEGGGGTANSHWERRYFMGELMIGTYSSGERGTISNLSLSLLNDTGWYEPNFHFAGLLGSVEHRGCEFCENSCLTPKESIADAFCWPDETDFKSLASCTPDYTAPAYCRDDWSLIGLCSVVQPYRASVCNAANVNRNFQYEKFGMRSGYNSRCYHLNSYKLSRNLGSSTVYLSELNAGCFETICSGNDVYIVIPDLGGKKKEIRCPTGEEIDLSQHNLGFGEGLVTCPNNAKLCSFWGCPEDCSGHGRCYKNTCYCETEYIGEDCSMRPCPATPCESGSTCNPDTGLCELDQATSTTEEIPEREETSEVGPAPETTAQLRAPSVVMKKISEKPPSTHSETKAAPSEDEAASSSSKPLERSQPSTTIEEVPSEEEEIEYVPLGPKKKAKFVPFTETPPSPSPSFPDRDPYKVPSFHAMPTYEVPAYAEPDPSDPYRYGAGRVLSIGYLAECVVFEDTRGDHIIHEKTSRSTTAHNGKWALTPFPHSHIIVDTRLGETCLDTFTNRRPVWRLRAVPGMKTISALSTLITVSYTPQMESNSQHRSLLETQRNSRESVSSTDANMIGENHSNSAAKENRRVRYRINYRMLRALGLMDNEILERNFIVEVYQTLDNEAKRAFIYNSMLSSTVTLCACFLDKSLFPDFETSDILFRTIGQGLTGGIWLPKVAEQDTMYSLLKNAQPSWKTSDSSKTWLVAGVVAHLNRLGLRMLYMKSRLSLLTEMARLATVVESNLCDVTAQLAAGKLSVRDYKSQTTEHQIQKLQSAVKLPNIKKILDSHSDTVSHQSLFETDPTTQV